MKAVSAVCWVLLLIPCCFGVNEQQNLNGTWVLSRPVAERQSDTSPEILTITQSGDELKVELGMKPGGSSRSVSQVFSVAGVETRSSSDDGTGELRVTASWKERDLVVRGTERVYSPQGERAVRITRIFSVSEDGKTLTVRTTRATREGAQSTRATYLRR